METVEVLMSTLELKKEKIGIAESKKKQLV